MFRSPCSHLSFVAVPLGCVLRRTNFHHKVAFKVVSPVIIISMLWCYPLSQKLRGKSNDQAIRTVKRLALLLLELTLPSIATSLVQVFLCDKFDNGSFLREQLTIPCNDSDRRLHWKILAGIGIVAYPIGGMSRKRYDRFIPPACVVGERVVECWEMISNISAARVCTVPMMTFAILYRHRHQIEKLGMELRQFNQSRGTGLSVRQFANSKKARQSFTSLTLEMQWLLPKIERFRYSAWWAGVVQLALRLLQTSFMAIVRICDFRRSKLLFYITHPSSGAKPTRASVNYDVLHAGFDFRAARAFSLPPSIGQYHRAICASPGLCMGVRASTSNRWDLCHQGCCCGRGHTALRCYCGRLRDGVGLGQRRPPQRAACRPSTILNFKYSRELKS